MRRRAFHLSVITTVVIVLAALSVWFAAQRADRLPAPGTTSYAAVTSAFYRGLAGLQVGLLDGARADFAAATDLVPEEPASWANLGLAHLRLGDLDAAVAPVERAAALAPGNDEVALLVGRMELARGRVDQGLAALRRAVQLGPENAYARFALAEELERAALPGALDEAEQLLGLIQASAPDNVALLLERARLAARRRDPMRLVALVLRLKELSRGWPDMVLEQLRALEAVQGDFDAAARATAFLRNVIAQLPAFQEDLRAVRTPAEEIMPPFTRFIRLSSPTSNPAPADAALTWTPQPAPANTPAAAVAAVNMADGPPAFFATDGREVRELGGSVVAPIADVGFVTTTPRDALVPIDWNNDFRTDLVVVGSRGIRLLLQQDDREFADTTPSGPGASLDAVAAWSADVEMDGDLDLVVGTRDGPPVMLRNNGDGTWFEARPFTAVEAARGFAWADIDADGDPDAVFLESDGEVRVFANRQASLFEALPPMQTSVRTAALAAGDIDADGALDLVLLSAEGAISRWTWGGAQWDTNAVATWTGAPAGEPGASRLLLGDLDNNGGIDLVAASVERSAVWLSDERLLLQPAAATPAGEVVAVADSNNDGLLDLVTLDRGIPTWLLARGQAGYHWQVVNARAQTSAGDQRINSYGVGGEVEIRSGLLTQKQVMLGRALHFGLGTRTDVDVIRILWPNGVVQAEFDPPVDGAVTATQRLKGSCPWVFTYDGTGMQFVTDFLWRSPLGLRINAQDTAAVSQTEDWVRIRGDQLVPRDGVYDVRITAELWETHFVDHVALLAIDHPEAIDVFVDERFGRTPPRLEPIALRPPAPVLRAWDDRGDDVTAIVASRDGRYLATFSLGRYQGIAAEHFVEFELSEPVTVAAPMTLVAHGWIYPTDSSINVAIGQGSHVVPKGLSLEARDASGTWRLIAPDLGFPAGKNKTVLIPLDPSPAGLAAATRYRLRTNLEIYWDALAVGEQISAAAARIQRIAASRSVLRFRGFSETEYGVRHMPETPAYGRLASTAPRWRDLTGYYTRFGDVLPLTAAVDDRFVIMNAGDELALEFPALPPPAPGWRRDFVLIGDGWEKDGDFNTEYSDTVGPLPRHDSATYQGPTDLHLDPAYLRHRDDWQHYHTRFVSPRQFLAGLWAQ